MSTDWLLGSLLVALFALAIFLAAAETALLRVSRVRVAELADTGDRRARRLQRLIAHPVRVLNAVLLAALGTQIGAATVAGILANRHFSGAVVTATSALLTVLLFVYSEAIPKTYAVRHPVQVGRRLSLGVAALERVLRPVVSGLVWFADIQAPGKGIATSPTVTESELLRLSATAADEGAITPTDARLIERAFAFGDHTADEVMVPRPDVVWVDQDSRVDEALELALSAGHRRLPVAAGDLDQIVGVAYVRTLAALAPTQPQRRVESIARSALFVPESRRIVDLLADMQRAASHIAIVVDEHGGTSGLVTIEDIAEELLGAITEADSWQPARRTGNLRWLLDGRTPIDDAEEALGRELPRGEWTTLGGLLMAEAGRVLDEDDEVSLGGMRFRVARAHRHRIVTVEVWGDPSTTATVS